ncbi:MAG: EAL domain-containing protein [Bryobacteraceae bacterium]|nr:EAL domain-containing protein [Bryobacteraceae bacterium]
MNKPLRVLQIEDSESDAALVVRLLEKAGYDVRAERVEEAGQMRAALATSAWDVVIADYHLPRFDAPAALRILHDSGRDIPFIVVSGAVGESVAVELMKAGAHDYVMKNNLPRLAPAVERELREAQTRREREQAEEALRESEERFAKAFHLSPVGNALVRLSDNTIVDVNHAQLTMIGYRREEIVGKRSGELDIFADRALLDQIARRFHEQGKVEETELPFRRKDGALGYAIVSGEVLNVGGERYALKVFNDITSRKQAEEKLTYQALHDPLTGLPNRTLFMEHLDRMFRIAQRHPESCLAVLFLDLDRFKVVNDSLGHLAGDELLTAVAARLKGVLRQSDVVARLGGDEFLIALDLLPGLHEAEEICRRILQQIRKPISLNGEDFVVTASIGVAPASPDYAGPKEMVRDADVAMYRAKEAGRDRFEVFDASMRDKLLFLLELEAGLRRAIQREEFALHYQPIQNLALGGSVGYEALLRWDHPLGLRLPGDFLQTAEDTGLMKEIDLWVLRNACRQVGRNHGASRGAYVSVNVSGSHFSDPHLPLRVQEALSESGLHPSRLVLEITETVMMENPAATARITRELRELGVGVQIDDFGTGYSSLSRLLNLPITALKIGQSFVASMRDSNGAAGIVSAVVTMAHGLGLRVVAEGIETREQFDFLRRIECDYGQGYFFSRPLPAVELFNGN